MNYCISVRPWWSSSQVESPGRVLFLVGFLGQKVLSGGLGRVTPAVGLEGEKPLPLAVLRQSLSGVQRGHSGTQGLA